MSYGCPDFSKRPHGAAPIPDTQGCPSKPSPKCLPKHHWQLTQPSNTSLGWSYPCQGLWELLQKPIKHPIASPIEQSRNSRCTKRPSTNYSIIGEGPIACDASAQKKWCMANFGYRFRENDLCAKVRNNLQRGQTYLGRSHRLPHACTFFDTHVHPLHVSYCRSFYGGSKWRTR